MSAEAPRLETPCQVKSGTVASLNATRPCQERTAVAHQRGVARPWQPCHRTLSRLQPFVATDWKILLRPGVGEGRNNVLKRSWCASPVFESVQNR